MYTLVEQGLSSWQISSSEWKKNWEHQCALISHTILSKTNTFNFYRKKSIKFFFDENYGFLKVFGSNLASKNWFLD